MPRRDGAAGASRRERGARRQAAKSSSGGPRDFARGSGASGRPRWPRMARAALPSWSLDNNPFWHARICGNSSSPRDFNRSLWAALAAWTTAGLRLGAPRGRRGVGTSPSQDRGSSHPRLRREPRRTRERLVIMKRSAVALKLARGPARSLLDLRGDATRQSEAARVARGSYRPRARRRPRPLL